MDKHASQYKGGRQHDAQEFLLWLLDQVHEDLNLANRRRHRLKSVNSGGGGSNGNGATSEVRSDEVLAADALAAYMRSNNSFVVDVFQVKQPFFRAHPFLVRKANVYLFSRSLLSFDVT